MLKHIFSLKLASTSLLILLFIFPININAQSKLDSIITPVKRINVADISISISESDLKTDIILYNLKNDKSLVAISKENDSIINVINKDLKIFNKNKNQLIKRNNRSLGNSLVLWEQGLTIIDKRISIISKKIATIDDNIHDFEKERTKINTTIEFLKDNHEAYSLQTKAKNLKNKIDTIISTLNKQKNKSVKILDKLISTKGKIIPIVSIISDNIDNRRTSITQDEHLPLFKLDYFNKENWDITSSYELARGEFNRLYNFIHSHIKLFSIHIIFIILTILFFVYIDKHPINDITNEPTYYKLAFKKLQHYPRSLGFILGLLAFVGVYTNMPLIFIDLYRFIFIIPLFFLLIGSLNKIYRKYVYIFTAIMISQIVYIFIPEQTIYSRIILLVVNILEIIGFIQLLSYTKKNNVFNKIFFNKALIRISIFILVISIIGLISNIFGFVVLAELLMRSIFSSLLALILMTILLVTTNGLLITFMESDKAHKMNILKNNQAEIIKASTRTTNFIVFLFLSHFILKSFGLEKKTLELIDSTINYQVSLGSTSFSLLGIFSFIFVIWLSIVSSKIIKSLLEEDILPRIDVEKGLLHTIAMIAKYTIITIGFFIAMSVAGIPFGQMAIVFSAFGVGIGFGLQNIFNNLVSGFILLFERPIKIGDTVEVGTLIGQVKSIGIRSSKVRTFDGAEIIVPNGNLISNEVINWTLSDRKRRVEIIVGIAYGSNPHIAKDIFIKVLKKHPHIVSNPEPDVYFREFGESSLDFRLLFWTYQDWVKVKSDIIFDIHDSLSEAGIEIPFPQQDLHIRSIDESVEIKHRSNSKQNL